MKKLLAAVAAVAMTTGAAHAAPFTFGFELLDSPFDDPDALILPAPPGIPTAFGYADGSASIAGTVTVDDALGATPGLIETSEVIAWDFTSTGFDDDLGTGLPGSLLNFSLTEADSTVAVSTVGALPVGMSGLSLGELTITGTSVLGDDIGFSLDLVSALPSVTATAPVLTAMITAFDPFTLDVIDIAATGGPAAIFPVVAPPIPLPAGMVLLLGGLGVFGLAARRRKA